MTSSTTKSSKTPLVVIIASGLIIIAGLIYAQSLVNQLLLALFLSIICAQPIYWMQKKGLSLGLAIAIVLLGMTGIFVGFVEIIGTSVSSFSQDAPIYEQNLEDMGADVIAFFNRNGVALTGEKLAGIIVPSKVMGYTAGALGQLGAVMGNALTIFFLFLFLLLELNSVSLKARAIISHTNVPLDYLNGIGHSIRHYLSIKTATSFLTGFIIWICLLIVGVDYAIIWALIAFLLNYIPNIGSIIAALPAVLFALIQLGTGGAIWTIITFVSVNMLVGNVFEPRMMGKGLGLSTFIVFFGLIFWGFILGTVGMFLSVPLTMAIKIMLEQSPKTKWMAVILGTDDDAKALIE